MNLVHQLNMKKQVHCRKDWLSILPPHKIISYRTTITPCNKKMIFRIGRSQCPNIPLWQETMRNVWKFRSSHPYKSICFEYFGNILGHYPWWDLILIKLRNEELKIYENSTSPRVFSWEFFTIFRTVILLMICETVASVTGFYFIFSYILPIHFHLSQ